MSGTGRGVEESTIWRKTRGSNPKPTLTGYLISSEAANQLRMSSVVESVGFEPT